MKVLKSDYQKKIYVLICTTNLHIRNYFSIIESFKFLFLSEFRKLVLF